MNDNPKNDGPKFNPVWLAVGIGVGTAIGVALKNIAVGIGVGAAIGIGLAFAIPGGKK
jgi:hypothetical protein